MSVQTLVGNTLMLIGILVQSYFTAWVFVKPSLGENSSLHLFFPDIRIAIFLPITLFLLALGGISHFVTKKEAVSSTTATEKKEQ